MALVVGVCAIAAAAAAAESLPLSKRTECETLSSNPVWPSGVSKEDVDELVNQIMKDRSMNIGAIPDVLERRIYTSTVYLTMNALYHALSSLHGMNLLAGYELRLIRRSHDKPLQLASLSRLNERILEKVADRLIANKAINQPLIPDFVERSIYMNCLKLIFRLLDTIAATFSITFCGHEMKLSFDPSPAVIQRAAKRAALGNNHRTDIDIEKLRQTAREEFEDSGSGISGEFAAQLHASLYGLVLGIADDLLANIEITILSDQIKLDVVEMDEKEQEAQKARKKDESSTSTPTNNKTNTTAALPFAVGVGVGASVMALISRN